MSGTRASRFAYQAVYRYLCGLIEAASGAAHPGQRTQRLPALRKLATQLQVSIATVQAAYTLLEAQGRVYPVARSGYYLRERDHCVTPIDMAPEQLLQRVNGHACQPQMRLLGHTPPPSPLRAALQAAERQMLREPASGPYRPAHPCGDIDLRRALAARYSQSANRCWHADQVYLGNDACAVLQGLVLALGLRGQTVMVLAPCDWALLRTLQSCGVRVLEYPLCPRGRIDLDRFATWLKRYAVRLVILDATINLPHGSLMPLAQRREVTRVLAHGGVWLLENDTAGDLCFSQVPRLRDLADPERLLVMGSLEPALGREAGYGYLLAHQPARELCAVFMERPSALAPVRQRAVARLLDTGQVEAHLAHWRDNLQRRQKMLRRSLAESLGDCLEYRPPAGGAGLWARCRQPVDMHRVFEQMLQQQIVVMPGELFSLRGHFRQHLLLGLVPEADPLPMWQALAEVLREEGGNT